MSYKKTSTKISQSIKVWLCCLSLSLSMTSLPALAQEVPNHPTLQIVPKEKLQNLIDYAKTCNQFAAVCKERVKLLESHATESDKLLEARIQEAQHLQEELNSEKRKNKWLFPGAALALGLIVGFAAK